MTQSWIAFALLSGAVSANIPETTGTTPAWQKDYVAARVRAGEVKKPLLVVIGEGKDGWQKMTGDDGKATQLMAANYVCLYADKSTPAGKALADVFEVRGSTGVVISDRKGQLQAFNHSGDMSQADLVKALVKYAAADHVAVTTESNAPPVPVHAPASGYFYSSPSTSCPGGT